MTVTCLNSNVSLINYSVELQPDSTGVISYTNVSIVDSRLAYRVWTFTFRGTITRGKFVQIFHFDPNCEVPNGNNTLRLDQIDFSYRQKDIKGQPFKREPFSGTMIINNRIIGITDCRSLIDFSYDRKNAIFTMRIDVSRYINEDENNDIYANLWIKDGAQYCPCWCTTSDYGCSTTNFIGILFCLDTNKNIHCS